MEKYKPDELETLIQIIKYDKARGKTYSDVVKMELSWQRMQNLGFVIKTNHKWLNDILVANKDKTLEEIINLVKAQRPDFDIVSSLKSKLEPIFQMEKSPFKFKIDEIVELACLYAKKLYAQWDGDWESINKDEMSKKVQEYLVAYFTPKEHNTSDFIQTYDYSSREYARNLSKFVCDEIFAFCQKQINALFESTEQVIKEIVSSLKSKLEPIFQMETLPFKFKIDEVVALACREAKRLYAQWDGDWESINKNEMSKVQEDFIAYFTPKEHLYHDQRDFFYAYDGVKKYSLIAYARDLSKFVCDEIFALCQKQINARFNLNPHKQAIKEQEKRLINALLQKAKMKAMRIIIAKRFNKPSLMVCSHCGFIKYTSIMSNKPQCERCGALMSKKEL